MGKVMREIWTCDKPGCNTERNGSDGPPAGYSGKVSTEAGSGVVNAVWFACTEDHIKDAILLVVEVTHSEVWR